MPPRRTRPAAACSSSSCRSGSGRRPPAQVGARREHAQPGARRVDEGTVEVGELRRQLETVGVDHGDVCRAEPADVLLQLAGTCLVQLDGRHLTGEHRRLAAGRRAQVERPLAGARADGEPCQLRPAALRPDRPGGKGPLVDPLDAVRARQVGRLTRRVTPDEPHDRLGRLVLCAHERERVLLAEIAAPDVPDPVGIGVLERPLRERREQRREAVGEAAQHGVREGDRTLEPGAPDELHGLVHGGVAGDALDVAELVRAEPERCANGRVEPRHRPPCERLDGVVDRPDALHRAVGEPPGQREVAVVQALGRGAERPVGVGVVLEHAPQHLVGGRAGRAYRRPRSHASYAIRFPPSG